MARLLFLLFGLVLGAVQCQADIDPELSKLDGTWILYKIGVGYPAPNTPAEFEPTDTETIEIDAKAKAFIRKINGAVAEKTAIEIANHPENSPNPRQALVFLDSETYSFLEMNEAKGEMSLYQKCPLGAELADGHTYFYRKQ